SSRLRHCTPQTADRIGSLDGSIPSRKVHHAMKPLAILLVLVTALSDASRAVHAADAPPLPRADLPASIRPNPEWTAQAAKDAKRDFTSIPFDGITPNKLACDTTLRELPDGSWVMVMLGGGDTEPRPENHVLLTRSHDKGKTWSAMQPLDFGFPREGDTIAMVPSELMVHAGRCTLFVATHDGTFAGWKEWMSHSEDSCRTWSKPEPAPGRLHDRTFIRNHIVTRDGRILLPFQHYLDAPSCRNPRNGVLMSVDGGKTWTEHGNIRISNDDRYQGWAENNIVELGDGRIAMIIRADGYTHRELAGAYYYAESKDGGKTWPEFAVKSDIPNPGSKATLHPLGGDTVALLHNPNPNGCHPLALWISFDGMKTWPYQRVLVEHSSDGPGRSLNYPDGFVSKDKQWLHFAYDDNRHRAVHYSARLPPLESHADDAVPGSMLQRRGLPRVLFNNDSDDLKFAAYPETHGALWVPAGELVPRREITSVDDYLSYRIGPLAKTVVTGLSYCGNFGSPVWDVRRDHVAALGEDPLQPILGLWRRDGRRFFFSMRMNDKHHAWFNWPHLWDEFRRTHRHWFLGPPTEAEWTDDFLPWLNDPTKPSSIQPSGGLRSRDW
ncbi:MAG: sialidase family protein, partial [Planctomycetota bacterium]